MDLRVGFDMPAKKQSLHEFGQRLTQVQLAATLDVSQRAGDSRLETVAEYPTVPLLLQLCRVLKVSVDELLGLKPAPRVEPLRQPPEEKRLWRHLRVVARLPERDQRAVLRLIDTAARAGKAS